MCFGGSKGSGGHQGGNANEEDSAIRKQFSKEGKPAKEARAYFRDRDAGKFLSSTNYRQDELGNVKIDTAPKYFEDMTIAEVLDPEMYDSTKVNANITFKERRESDLNNLSKRDVIQARSRYNKYGPGSSEAMKGNIKKSFIDMVDYAEDGTVQGIGMNKTMGTEFYPSGKAKGQLVLDPKAAIVGLPSFTDIGPSDPKYDETREGFIGKGLTKFTRGIQENPLTLIPYVGMAQKFANMFTGGEEKTAEVVDTRPKQGERSNINTNLGLPEDFYARYEGDPQYDMFGDTAYPTVESRDAQFPESYRPPSSSMYVYDYGRDMLKDYKGMEYDRVLRDLQDTRMLGLSENANRALSVPMENPNYSALSGISDKTQASRDANRAKLALAPAPDNQITTALSNIIPTTNFFDNNDDDNQRSIATGVTPDISEDPYANYALADTGLIPTLGQSGYGGRYSYGAAAGSLPNSPFYLRYGLTRGAGFNPSVQARYVNPTNQTYFMAPRGLDTTLSDFQLA